MSLASAFLLLWPFIVLPTVKAHLFVFNKYDFSQYDHEAGKYLGSEEKYF